MLEEETKSINDAATTDAATTAGRRPRRRAASRPAGPPQPAVFQAPASATTELSPAQESRDSAAVEGTLPEGTAPQETLPEETQTEEKSPEETLPEASAPEKKAKKTATRRKTGKRAAAAAEDVPEQSLTTTVAAGDPVADAVRDVSVQEASEEPAEAPVKTPRKRTSSRRTKKAAAEEAAAREATLEEGSTAASGTASTLASADTTLTEATSTETAPAATAGTVDVQADETDKPAARSPHRRSAASGPVVSPVALLFQAPDPAAPSARTTKPVSDQPSSDAPAVETAGSDDDTSGTSSTSDGQSGEEAGGTRRRRSRGGRNRRKSSAGSDESTTDTTSGGDAKQAAIEPSGDADALSSDSAQDTGADDGSTDESGTEQSASSRRRRRRRRGGEDSRTDGDDPKETVVRVREPRAKKESISSVEGSTRIEAKKQRRREGREAGRRRPPILSESEFLARRESVERVMAIRQRGETTQIAVLEDDILVEHYVALESQNSIIGNVYLGRVQNVLPSMEAAFIDIGKGRNAVLYAGEVNWALMGGGNQPRKIENALKPGQTILVQVSKDPIGHKGARLTSQISLPGRYLVYVPAGGASGISRKLPDTERSRLKNLLKDILPEDAGVIVRTAAEGASEEELTRDVTRLTARWEDIEKKIKSGQAPVLLYGEPDTTIKVVRDLFTEDFAKLVISGDDAWDMVDGYVKHVAPDLLERLERFDGDGDIFAAYRIEEQIAKALDRKVWLPSGGSLVIDRTEAMTVVDVNTGKFTGSGGNLEETVTKNNLEAAEEMVRQLRLRDIGGIIVIDFIDMVLEHNRDLVLRRLVECLGRDRTRHQVAEVTSLGLVQMTRKRISTGLLEAFSHTCEACQGRGVVIAQDHVHTSKTDDTAPERSTNGSPRPTKRSSGRRRGGKSDTTEEASASGTEAPVAEILIAEEPPVTEVIADQPVTEVMVDAQQIEAVADEPTGDVIQDEPAAADVVAEEPVAEVAETVATDSDERGRAGADQHSDSPVDPPAETF